MIDPIELLSGPRGRRLLLEFARLSERTTTPGYHEGSLLHAVMYAAHELDPGRGTSRKLISFGNKTDFTTSIPPEEVARRIDRTELIDVTEENLREALAAAVDNARYYQEPDGEDVLTETPTVREALSRVADHIAASPLTDWWVTGIARHDQWAVRWTDNPDMFPHESASETLALWRHRVPINEEEARRMRPNDPAANYSFEWWSIPPIWLAHSSRAIFDSVPAGLWYSEDTGGMDQAWASKLRVGDDVRVLEIDGAEAWADLCRNYPLEVTAQKRHDWYRSTGRDGRWLIPDWHAVARNFDGIHLTVAGYLAASGTVIAVDEDFASTIAAWDLDQTWWLTDIVEVGDLQIWTRSYHHGIAEWSLKE